VRIGFPREIKDGEARAGATPDTVRALVARGHEPLVEAGVGDRVGYPDAEYRAAGAAVAGGPDAIFACPLVVKVKELQPPELALLRPGCVVFGYQQLARDHSLLEAVLRARVTCLAYESVRAEDGSRPLLSPMSTIAGLMSAPLAAWLLQRRDGPLSGSGVLLPGLDGVPPGRVLILGAGVAGLAAARAFLGTGCHVTLLVREASRAGDAAAAIGPPRSGTLEVATSSPDEVAARVPRSDVVVGAVAVRGRLSPRLVTRESLRRMRPGSVLIDIGIDMGGVAETSRQTKLSDPVFSEEGVLHYCVPNIPALVPRTATDALTSATLPYVAALAEHGLAGALAVVPALRPGVLVHDGAVADEGLAADSGRPLGRAPAAAPAGSRESGGGAR
jgi:alanine dehydrogenase